MDQFYANQGIMDKQSLERLSSLTVLLVGVGGLGGHLANGLVRLGIKSLIIVDPDVYQTSNLNRQLFSTQETLNQPKVSVVKEALNAVSHTTITPYQQPIETLDKSLYAHVDMVIDGVDTPKVKQTLETIASTLNVPLLHGAIGGWYGQYGIIMPNTNILKTLYGKTSAGLEETFRCPTFTLGIISYHMLGEFVKWVMNKPSTLINQIMWVDSLYNEQHLLYTKDDSNGHH